MDATAIINILNSGKVSPSEKRAVGDALISSANREDLSKVLEPFINNMEELQDNVEQIRDNVKSLANPCEDITYLYPYKLRLERVKRGDDEYNKSLERLSLILNQENVTDVLKKLKRTGVYLAGDAGIGKGIIANSIGAKIVADNEHYNEYAKMFVNCHEIMNMAQASWGTGMNNVEYLGAVYSAFKFGNDNKDCAVVLVFDEVNRCDARALLGAIYELVSSKRDKSYCKVCNGETLVYTDNIYIVITGNIGNAYKTGGLTDDTGFADRFRFVGLTGIFEDIKFVDKYMEYVKNELYPEISVDEIYSVLVDIYDVVQENSKVSKTISLRNLSNNIEESTSKEDFMNRVKSMFSAGDRERLGWYD